MAAIGIIGGMGPQASAHLLTLLVRDVPKHLSVTSDTDFPEIVLLSVPVPNFIANQHNLNQAKQILVERTKLLEATDCLVAGIACNTAHLLLPDLQAATTVPFVSIPQLVAAVITRAGAKRVGLLATPNTLASTLYDDALQAPAVLIRPSPPVAALVESLIFRQLTATTRPTDQMRLQAIITSFIATERLDTVILGCTELPLILGEATTLPVINTLQVLSDGLLTAFSRLSA